MLSVLTPYKEIFRRSYDKSSTFSGVTAGMWVTIVNGIATPIAGNQDISASVLRLVLDRMSDEDYESHDTMDAIAVVEGYGAVCKTDQFVATNIVVGSKLAVGNLAGTNLGKLILATAGSKVVAECISVSADALEFAITSPHPVVATAIAITTTTIGSLTINTLMTPVTIQTTGAVGPVAFSVTAGALPTGVTLVGAVVSGTPTVSGAYSFTVTATDSENSDTQVYSGNIST